MLEARLRKNFPAGPDSAGFVLDIDFKAAAGVTVLFGPSGSGKTLTLDLIAGFSKPDDGRVLLEGQILYDRAAGVHLPPQARNCGYVFQNYALFPHMNVRRNVGFGLRMQKVSRLDEVRRVDEALALVRLTAQAEKLPGQISGGQQQRVAIARAIVVEPQLVLMDEPLSNLDAKLRLEMRGEIRRIHTLLGSTTIYVTHDQDEALSLADRIVVLRDGQIRQVGTPHELYGRPAHADVAEFMGFRNVVTTHWDGRCVMIGGAQVLATPVDVPPQGPALAAIRPDDLVAGHGVIEAVVQQAEYRGRDYYGIAHSSDGTALYFRSDEAVASGEMVRLGVDPARVLVFSA